MNLLSSFLLFAAENGAVDPNASGADLSSGLGTGGGSNIFSMLLLIVPLILLYVIMIVPQKKKEKKLQKTIDSAIVGDKITTIGGISGKIVNIKDDEVTFETSVERTKMTVVRWAIKDVIKPVSDK